MAGVAPTNVSSPEAFVTAVARGAVDIIITQHLDLTLLPLPLKTYGACGVGCVSPVGGILNTRSIRGMCEDASLDDLPDLSEPPLYPLRPGQCIVLGQEDMLPLQSPDIWLDNLYTRAFYRNVPDDLPRINAFVAMISVTSSHGLYVLREEKPTRYLTRMTIQGDDRGSTVGVFADESTYIEDSTFLNLGGSQQSECPECDASVIAHNASVSIVSSTFADPYIAPGSRYIHVQPGDMSSPVTKSSLHSSTHIYTNSDPIAPQPLRLQLLNLGAGAVAVVNCTFDGNMTQPLEQATGTFFYSDNSTLEIKERNAVRSPIPLEAIPDPDDNPRLSFLTRDDRWFAELRNELTGEPLPPESFEDPVLEPGIAPSPGEAEGPLPMFAEEAPREVSAESSDIIATPTTSDPASGSSNNDPSYGGIIGGVVATLVGVAVCVLAIIFVVRKKRRKKHKLAQRSQATSKHSRMEMESIGRPLSVGHASSVSSSALQKGEPPPGKNYFTPRTSMGLNAVPSVGQGALRSGAATYWDTFNATVDPSVPSGGMTRASSQPAENAPIQDRLEFLHSQLDSFGPNDVILDRFFLLGYAHRRQGGQGLVAFARGIHDQLDYAIKFFVVRESFDAERRLYDTDVLGALLPQVEAEYDPQRSDRQLMDCRGAPLPPFMVMEKGESLIDWTTRSYPDLFQGIAVLLHVALRLRDMHQDGFVHRDIKPGNIMFLPRKNSWTVIDFGCTGRTGEPSPLSFTVQYAPPEVIAAYLSKDKTIIATEAMDAWALGVVSFELLTGGTAFPVGTHSKQIMKQLQGEIDLPWEGDQNLEARRKLGMFRQPILSLLRRDPEERGTVASFYSACQQVFTATSADHALLPR